MKKDVIYNEDHLDKDGSVVGRDLNKETQLYKKLYKRYVDHFINEMERLESEPDFVRDDSYNGVYATHHIMYKLRCDDSGRTCLLSADGHRAYEFLIEFDVKDAAYGIYYGCRALILDGDQEKEIDVLTSEWNAIREEVRFVLNSTFENINFMPERFQPTNNANNKTYWTFWITLYPEEDILKVGALAVKLIKGVYENFLTTGSPGVYNARAKATIDTGKTRYTKDAYLGVLHDIKTPGKRKIFEQFLSRGVETGLLEKDNRFELCWKVKDSSMSNDLFSFVIAESCSQMGFIKGENTQNEQIPWALFIPIMLSPSGGPLDDLRKSYRRFKSDDPKLQEAKLDYVDDADEIIKMIFPLESKGLLDV